MKYKAYDTQEKEFIDPDKVRVNGNGLIEVDAGKEWVDVAEQSRIKILLYTGFKDADGKEIYDHDITNSGAIIYFDRGVWFADNLALYSVHTLLHVVDNLCANDEFRKRAIAAGYQIQA